MQTIYRHSFERRIYCCIGGPYRMASYHLWAWFQKICVLLMTWSAWTISNLPFAKNLSISWHLKLDNALMFLSILIGVILSRSLRQKSLAKKLRCYQRVCFPACLPVARGMSVHVLNLWSVHRRDILICLLISYVTLIYFVYMQQSLLHDYRHNNYVGGIARYSTTFYSSGIRR